MVQIFAVGGCGPRLACQGGSCLSVPLCCCSNGSATPMSGAYGQPGPGAGRGRGQFPGRGGGRSGSDSRMIDRMVTIIKGPLR